jgi:hypothetical protein
MFAAAACDRGTPAGGMTSAAPPQARTAAASADWDAFVASYIEDYFTANPVFAVYAGRHEFDGRMQDFSAAALQREIARLRRARAQAAAFDAATLGETAAFERDYLLSQIDGDLFWLAEAQWPFRSPDFYLGWLDPDAYLNKPYAPLPQRMRAYVAYAKTIPTATAQIRANLRTPMPRPWIEYGINAFAGFAAFYDEDVAPVYAEVGDAELQAELRQVNAAAAAAMRELAAWLESERPRATDDFALGAPLYARMLEATEAVSVPLTRIAAVGQADLESNSAALRDACARFLPGGTVAACVDKVRSRKPEGGPVAGATAQLPELEAFLRATRRTSPTSRRLDRSSPACPRPITSPRPTRSGRRRSARSTCNPRPVCSSSRRTRYGPGTSCTSCTRTAADRRSASCSRATPSPRAGRITPRK